MFVGIPRLIYELGVYSIACCGNVYVDVLHISQPYVNIFTSFFIFHHTVNLTSEISCLQLLSISCHCSQYPCLTFVFEG